MQSYWGVDSVSPVTQHFFARVTAWAGRPPDFWGRYLWNRHRQPDLSQDEIRLLHQNNCKVLPVFNRLEQAWDGFAGFDPHHHIPAGIVAIDAYKRGFTAAKQAEALARALGLHNGVRIYADLENWTGIATDWIRGWTEALRYSLYKPGLYGNTLQSGWAPPLGVFAATATGSLELKVSLRLWTNSHRTLGVDPPRLPGTDGKLCINLPKPIMHTIPGLAVQVWQHWLQCPLLGAPSGAAVDVDIALAPGYLEMH